MGVGAGAGGMKMVPKLIWRPKVPFWKLGVKALIVASCVRVLE
jgi:hypothetical protein